jgi:hypothetical protein
MNECGHEVVMTAVYFESPRQLLVSIGIEIEALPPWPASV